MKKAQDLRDYQPKMPPEAPTEHEVLYKGGTVDKRKLENLWDEEIALETKHELMQKTKKVARYPKP